MAQQTSSKLFLNSLSKICNRIMKSTSQHL